MLDVVTCSHHGHQKLVIENGGKHKNISFFSSSSLISTNKMMEAGF